LLTVTGKRGKRRLVPLHPTTLEALTDYERVRAPRAAPAGPFFIGINGRRLSGHAARALFRALAHDCQLQTRPGCGPPRLHDMRHRFAVNSLIDAHRASEDVDARVATLADYLGHVDPVSTYWYLTASAELMGVVSERVAAFHQKGRRA
jgi:integrase